MQQQEVAPEPDEGGRMKGTRTILVIGVAMVGTALAPASASAEERTCRGSLGAVTVDNLRVPQGGSCTLNGTRVKGTVKVERSATLSARGVRVIGNVQGEHARRVDVIQGSRVGGSVQVKQGGAATVLDSHVTGDVQAFQNTGGVRIARNRIDGNLQCKENRPAPTGGGNVVQGNKEDQCSRL
jgi:hypothetical protein